MLLFLSYTESDSETDRYREIDENIPSPVDASSEGLIINFSMTEIEGKIDDWNNDS